jgi:RNA polymerase sigma-70 factor (ECF subfamily)
MTRQLDSRSAEERFRSVFTHLDAVARYARRRGSRDADAIAAEVMTIAWRRLADVPLDDPRPWLYATARNLVFAEARGSAPQAGGGSLDSLEPTSPPPELYELDPALWSALRSLPPFDQEALLLVAWEDLTPGQAAKALGISPTAFRVRLLRARRRLRARLDDPAAESGGPAPAPMAHLDVGGTR